MLFRETLRNAFGPETGINFLTIAPSRVLWPGLAISLTVLSVNYIVDGLRDALDPRIRVS